MKRVVKFWNRYQSDEGQYSTVSTGIEVLPILVPDNAGIKELNAIVKQLGLKKIGGVKKGRPYKQSWHKQRLTHYIKLDEMFDPKFSSNEKYPLNLGFIQLPDSNYPLAPTEAIKTKMTEEQAILVRDATAYGVQDTGELYNPNPKTKGDYIMVMQEWNYYNDLELMGYDLEHFEKLLGVTDRYFEDSVESCSNCGIYDHKDNGYVYNHTYVEGEGKFGHRCGCYDEYCKNHIEDFANNPDKPLNRDLAVELINEKKLKLLETFIGGMTDGRGGYFNGKPTREGMPKGVLAEYQEKMPDAEFVFVHEESGQFQTYFSICKIMPKRKRKAA